MSIYIKISAPKIMLFIVYLLERNPDPVTGLGNGQSSYDVILTKRTHEILWPAVSFFLDCRGLISFFLWEGGMRCETSYSFRLGECFG